MDRTIVVIPCYDEAKRLPVQAFREFVAHVPGVQFLFVNDGSKDDTLAILQRLRDEMNALIAALPHWQPRQHGPKRWASTHSGYRKIISILIPSRIR